MLKKILISLFISLFGLLNTGLAYAGFFDQTNSTGNNFSASTLFFDIADNSGSPLFLPLFYSSDLKPGDSKSSLVFKIIKKGTEDFRYNVYFTKTAGADNLCNALQIEAKLNGGTVYKADLASLWVIPTPTITGGEDDWEFIVSLSDSSSDLMSKTCSFNLTFKAWQTDSDGTWGFSDSHSLGSTISTVTWEIPSVPEQNSGDTQNNSTDNPEPESSPEPTLSPTPTPTPTPEDVGTTETLTPTPTPTPIPENQETTGEGDPE